MHITVAVLVLALVSTAAAAQTTAPPADDGAVFVGAGDIANCQMLGGARATAALLDTIQGTVFTTGDHAYQAGSDKDFKDCYEPTWGRHKARTRPTPGIHDYNTSGAAPYFAYFGSAAGEPGKGYYSYNLGSWHVVALNSRVDITAGSAQLAWLKSDLAASGAACTVAYVYNPRFSSGTTHGSSTGMQPAWQVLYDGGVEVVVSRHEHNYERFAPQTPTGVADPVRGVREFIAGTGGSEKGYPFGTPIANSEVRDNTSFGVLKLTLNDGGYTWEFIPVAGSSFRDAGSGTCH